MRAVHLICRRNNITFDGLERLPGREGAHRLSCWAFSREEAHSLIGGWIYLHPISKFEPSEFGGIITGVSACKREEGAIEDGYAFTFKARREGRGQPWRGADHSMAWTGGIIDANFEHEQNDA